MFACNNGQHFFIDTKQICSFVDYSLFALPFGWQLTGFFLIFSVWAPTQPMNLDKMLGKKFSCQSYPNL